MALLRRIFRLQSSQIRSQTSVSPTPVVDVPSPYNDDNQRLSNDMLSLVDQMGRKNFIEVLADEKKTRSLTKIFHLLYSLLTPETQDFRLTYPDVDYLLRTKQVRKQRIYLIGKLGIFEKCQRARNMKKTCIELKPENEPEKTEKSYLAKLFIDGKPHYAFNHNSFVCSKTKKQFSHWKRSRLALSALHEQKIVLDFSYDVDVSLKQRVAVADQLRRIKTFQAATREPFDVHLCNFDAENSPTEPLLRHRLAGDLNKLFFTTWKQSYLDVFPRDKLVYLTPHTDQKLVYNPDDIYIIGAIADVGSHEPHSAEPARAVRAACFPLDDYSLYVCPTKCLRISDCFKILLKLKESNGDMGYALKESLHDGMWIDLANIDQSYIDRKNERSKAYIELKMKRFNMTREEVLSTLKFQCEWMFGIINRDNENGSSQWLKDSK